MKTFDRETGGIFLCFLLCGTSILKVVRGQEWRAAVFKVFAGRIVDNSPTLADQQQFVEPAYYSRYSPYRYTIRPIPLVLAEPLENCDISQAHIFSGKNGTSQRPTSRLLVLLVRAGGCNVLAKIKVAEALSVTALLMYSPDGRSFSPTEFSNPLRVDSNSGQTLGLLTVGISQSIGKRLVTLLHDGHMANVTIEPSTTPYSKVDDNSQLIFYTCIAFSVVALMMLMVAGFLYAYWFWRTRQRLRHQVSLLGSANLVESGKELIGKLSVLFSPFGFKQNTLH